MADCGHHFPSQVAEFNGRVAKKYVSEFARNSPRGARGGTVGTVGTVARVSEPATPAQSHPSTRAWGQDDVSYTNSLK